MFPFFPASFPWIFPSPGGPCLHVALLAWPAAGTKTLRHIGNSPNDKKKYHITRSISDFIRTLLIHSSYYIYIGIY